MLIITWECLKIGLDLSWNKHMKVSPVFSTIVAPKDNIKFLLVRREFDSPNWWGRHDSFEQSCAEAFEPSQVKREERTKISNLSPREDFTSSHPPAIPKSQREIVWASPSLHTISEFQLLLEGIEAGLLSNAPVYLRLIPCHIAQAKSHIT